MRSLVSSYCLHVLALNDENALFRCSDYGCVKIMAIKLHHKDYYNFSVLRTQLMPLETKLILFFVPFYFFNKRIKVFSISGSLSSDVSILF